MADLSSLGQRQPIYPDMPMDAWPALPDETPMPLIDLYGARSNPTVPEYSSGMSDLSSLGQKQPTFTDWLVQTWPARLARDAWSAVTLPGDVYTGRVTPNDPEFYERALGLAGLVTSGTLGAPRGALGAGMTRPPRRLPMDVESRMQRAREMGFHTENTLYHGTAVPEFKAFDLGKAGSVTGTPQARQGIWMSADDARPANIFAEYAAKQTGGNPRVMPLFARTECPHIIELEGYPKSEAINRAIEEAWKAGHDAVLLRNHRAAYGGDSLIVKNPNQLRSPQAAFEPKRRNSSNLLAGFGAAAAVLPQFFKESDTDDDR